MDQNVQTKVQKFFDKYESLTFNKKELLISPNKISEGLFLLKKGTVRMYTISTKGEELTLNTFKPFSMFPMAWILNDLEDEYYYEALDKVEVQIAPKITVLKFLKNNNEVLLDLLKRIYRGLQGYFTKMEYLMMGNAAKRLLVELIIKTKRFGVKNGEKLTIDRKITESELASDIGIARETVSREIRKLTDKGLITYKKSILTIHDLPKLEDELI